MSVEVLLLGAAQDAGLPQPGCCCVNCEAVRTGTLEADGAVSLAVVDTLEQRFWLVDATPDIRQQLALVGARYPGAELAGVLLTHTHIGHYTGLMFLGREAMNTQRMPVHASARVCAFLREHAPWKQLVDIGNIVLHEVAPGVPVTLSARLAVTAREVPHRAEYGDTLAYTLAGPEQRLFYLPDIDRWSDWDEDLRTVVEAHDISLLDATFFDADELPGRDLSQIPHPLVTDTVARLSGVGRAVCLIHLNHTNPLFRQGSARDFIARHGLQAGQRGMSWTL